MSTTPQPTRPQSAPPKQYQDTLPRLQLDQNSRVYVRVNPMSQKSQPLQGEFLGTCHYEFLILRLPSVPGLLNKLLPQTRIEVRYMSDGAVSTFTTEIINYSVKPSLLLFTTYPDRMSIMETRRHHRVMCALPIIINTPKGDAVGIICDLSLGGCRIALEMTGQTTVRELAVGDNLVLQTVLSAEGLISGSAAIVRNVEVSGTRVTAGISFADKHEDFIAGLTKYINMVQVLA